MELFLFWKEGLSFSTTNVAAVDLGPVSTSSLSSLAKRGSKKTLQTRWG